MATVPRVPALACLGALTLCVLASVMSCGRPQRLSDPEPGVALSLAIERARVIRDLRYELGFDLPSSAEAPVTGHVTIRFGLADRIPVALDFTPGREALTSVRVGGRRSSYRAIEDHLIIPADELVVGENVVDIAFRAGDAALNRNPDFLYTLFVPARAHLTFPCFDQPDLKAKFSLTLTMPSDWQAAANGAEASRQPSGDRVTVTYAETAPIPTYLFAFAAGRFQVDTAERQGRSFRMFHRETDAAKVARNRDAVFDLHAQALRWLEDYTALPYAFGKFDFVLIPSFQFSGMEHPGAVFYNAGSILLDESATEAQFLNRASTISHETSHMWFGDLVTMRWFDDVWMKEVFANFMAAKIVNPSFPNVNHDLRFLVAHYPAAYAVDRTEGTHPIRQPLENLSEAGSLYGAIIYQKAPIAMRQLEQLVGADAFRDSMRAYLAQYRFGNATWLDLVRILDDRTEQDVTAWSKAWIEEEGRPQIQTGLGFEADRTVSRLVFTQTDLHPGRSLKWPQRMKVLIGTASGVRTIDVDMSGPSVAVPEAKGAADVRFVLPTGGGLAYGGFVLDAWTRRYLLDNVGTISDPVTRGAAWIALWEEMLEELLSPSRFIDAVLKALPGETVQQNAQLMVGYLGQAYWRFLTPESRLKIAPRVEDTLRKRLDAASVASAKAVYFNGFRSMALTPAGVDYLDRVWARKVRIAGLPFAEADEATMALELAVRSVPNAAAMLDEQRHRFTNPDRKARFEYVIPAVSDDPDIRLAFFNRLSDVANRRHEPWVIEGLSYLHHPLRAAASASLVRPSLDLLPEIQRTGDIFLPKNWTDATLSGHNSAEVAGAVRVFLTARPDFPLRLRRIVLQSADDVFRASQIVIASP